MKAPVLPVETSRADARRTYDRLSGVYDLTEGLFERGAISHALKLVRVKPGERVLELGPGTGRALARLERAAAPGGSVTGLDISRKMLEQVRAHGRAPSAALIVGDVAALPFAAGRFDVVFMSFVLELLPSEDIERCLADVVRVLRPGGRLVNLSLSRAEPNIMTQLYERGHTLMPRLLDCRPIYASESAQAAGLHIARTHRIHVWGLPAEIVVALKPEAAV